MNIPRSRKTKVMLEQELNEIYHLLLEGITAEEIKRNAISAIEITPNTCRN